MLVQPTEPRLAALSPPSGTEGNCTNWLQQSFIFLYTIKEYFPFLRWPHFVSFSKNIYALQGYIQFVCVCVCTWPSPTKAETPTDRSSSELSEYLAVIRPITPPWMTWTKLRIISIRAQISDMGELITSSIYHLDDAKESHQVTVLFWLQLKEFQRYDGEHDLENAWEETNKAPFKVKMKGNQRSSHAHLAYISLC